MSQLNIHDLEFHEINELKIEQTKGGASAFDFASDFAFNFKGDFAFDPAGQAIAGGAAGSAAGFAVAIGGKPITGVFVGVS